ncbi:hypothetical protein L596_027271 [Steinernema carpocapsae]|uniref:Uncharacterized protein n=1 Tax=Steinernema carpocapsae TaxID=34508 RepID=A0A4U5M3U0_STECR|nr:hypothetical protein L596_027271 [Steinernema carpocapsae]
MYTESKQCRSKSLTLGQDLLNAKSEHQKEIGEYGISKLLGRMKHYFDEFVHSVLSLLRLLRSFDRDFWTLTPQDFL